MKHITQGRIHCHVRPKSFFSESSILLSQTLPSDLTDPSTEVYYCFLFGYFVYEDTGNET